MPSLLNREVTQFCRRSISVIGLALLSLNAASVYAQEATKSEPIATDRPDFVESGQVVGKGRFQFETGLNFDRSKVDGVTLKSLSNSALLRFGIAESLEFRIETDGFIRATASGVGTSLSQNGFGDTALGVKWQMQDSDEASGRPAIAWLVHADMASGSKEFRGQGTRPSIRAVFEWELADDASFGVMPGIVLNRNDDGKRYNVGILAATYSRPLADGWRGFVEVSGQQLQSRANGGNVTTFDFGVSHLISNDVQVDAWVSKGLSKAAPTIAAGVGFAIRF